MEARNHVSKVRIRTMNHGFVGSLAIPVNTRLKEFMNRNEAWLSLSHIQVTPWFFGKPGAPQRIPEIRLQKNHIQYMILLSEDVKAKQSKVYERDVIGARMHKEVFSFVLTGGIMISGEVVGGEKTIIHHRSGFLAVSEPRICDLRGGEMDIEPRFVLLNLQEITYYEKQEGSQQSFEQACKERSEVRQPEESMDFSDFESQFITLDRPPPSSSGQES